MAPHGSGAMLSRPRRAALPMPSQATATAAIAPAGLRTAGEVADGVQPIFMVPERPETVTEAVLEGIAKAGRGKTLADVDIAPFVRVKMGDDLQACRNALKPEVALYIGGMGARDKNFYNDYAKRLGYEEAAVKIQDAFLAGRREEAVAAVPDGLIDEISLAGPAERIRERLAVWQAAAKQDAVGSLLLADPDPAAMRLIAETVL